MTCPNCNAQLLENGCEECDHKTDGTDCMCGHCNNTLDTTQPYFLRVLKVGDFDAMICGVGESIQVNIGVDNYGSEPKSFPLGTPFPELKKAVIDIFHGLWREASNL
jgi:hypothetical protein